MKKGLQKRLDNLNIVLLEDLIRVCSFLGINIYHQWHEKQVSV